MRTKAVASISTAGEWPWLALLAIALLAWQQHGRAEILFRGGIDEAIVAVGILASTLATAAPALAATVFSDTFNYGANTVLNAGNAQFGGNWTTTGGTVDYLNATSGFGGLCGGAPACIDLDGSTGDAGLFSTTLSFGQGSYLVTLSMLGSGRGSTETFTVALGSVLSFTLASSGVLSGTFAFTVGAAGSTLSFQNSGGDNVGAILQSVKVDTVAPVPLPAAGGLLVAGVGALAALRRRKARLA